MKTRDDVLLEQAYKKVLLRESPDEQELLLKKLVGLIAEREQLQQGDYGHDVLGQQIDEVWSKLEGMGMTTREINQYCQAAGGSGVAGRSGAAASQYLRHSDQTPYTQDEMGINTSHYKTVQPHMGKKQHDEDELSDAQTQEALAILNQYAQGDITAVAAAKMFKDLYEKGAGQGPKQDDLHYTKLK